MSQSQKPFPSGCYAALRCLCNRLESFFFPSQPFSIKITIPLPVMPPQRQQRSFIYKTTFRKQYCTFFYSEVTLTASAHTEIWLLNHLFLMLVWVDLQIFIIGIFLSVQGKAAESEERLSWFWQRRRLIVLHFVEYFLGVVSAALYKRGWLQNE